MQSRLSPDQLGKRTCYQTRSAYGLASVITFINQILRTLSVKQFKLYKLIFNLKEGVVQNHLKS
jgi:hypothetical protein